MVDRDGAEATGEPPAMSPLFQGQWHVYRTMVDHNYLFHREAYGWLRRVVEEEAAQPFRFLDIACGDASATVGALAGTNIAAYHGIDRSETALALARPALATLGCPVTLEQRDFAAALRDFSGTVDVAWVGLSLHHLQTAAKLEVMRDVRRILGAGGLFLAYEDASPDGEDREGWMRRWAEQEAAWTAYNREGWDLMMAHVSQEDYPETASRWRDLGREAGFGSVRELFVAPTDLLRLYAFGV